MNKPIKVGSRVIVRHPVEACFSNGIGGEDAVNLVGEAGTVEDIFLYTDDVEETMGMDVRFDFHPGRVVSICQSQVYVL